MAKRTTSGKSTGPRAAKPKPEDEVQDTSAAVDSGDKDVDASEPKPDMVDPATPDAAPTPDDAGQEETASSGIPPIQRSETEPESQGADPDAPRETDDAPRGSDLPPAPAQEGAPRQSALPMVFGGMAAGLVGALLLYGAAITGLVDLGSRDTAARVDALEAEISDLSGRMDNLADTVASVSDEAGQIAEDLTASAESLRADIAALTQRLEEIEVQPIPEAELPQEVVNAYERRFADMQAGLDARLSEIETAADRASEVEAAAETRANAAAARAALAEVNGALQSGGPFAAPLEEIAERTDAEIPAILSQTAAEGIPSEADIVEGFPPAARAALVASLAALAESGEIGGLQAFMRTQFGARSLEPQEGDDPDAVLSRAEAAVRAGDIGGALTEIEALPDAGQAELAAWADMARLRRDALAAADTLSPALNES
ncbi:COG4223 family protein [Anianabacter salinae]|uniref:COG4223 family protein n=1 Tax=Anianabacter salinae TaxID=2851023 RepID=UPI00225DF9E0|nr:hypothetical protein [Anianabacter salinae]MBV0913447.1 hypothetical protein [Anianabacter salinae]